MRLISTHRREPEAMDCRVECVVTVRHVLIGLNLVAVIAIVGYLIWAVLSPKRASEETRPRTSRRSSPTTTSRAAASSACQGWALLFAAIVAVALPLYWLHEPSRQKESVNYFTKNAVDAGRDPLLELADAHVRPDPVAAVRQLPRRRRPAAVRCRRS